MPAQTPTPDKAEMRERQKHARRWLELRKSYLFTQEALAAALGVSRRTVQYVEAGRAVPWLSTQAKFRDLARKCRREYAEDDVEHGEAA